MQLIDSNCRHRLLVEKTLCPVNKRKVSRNYSNK